MVDFHYPEKDLLRVNADGSQVGETNTAGAGVHCKLCSQHATVGVNKSNFDGEIEAICLARQQLLLRLKHLKECNSSSFSQLSAKSKKINDIKQALKYLQAFKKIVKFQRVPSHAGLEGNEIADKLAKKGTTLHTIETPPQADSLKKKKKKT